MSASPGTASPFSVFVTVGAQMPFDRLIRAVDDWAGAGEERSVFAQIGPTDFQPRHIAFERFLPPVEFRRHVEQADAIVAHAGMGSIITALEVGKPILVMPRRGDLKETRNDHQVATAKRFQELGRVAVAFDEHELAEKLDALVTFRPTERIAAHASPQLLDAVRAFLRTPPARTSWFARVR